MLRVVYYSSDTEEVIKFMNHRTSQVQQNNLVASVFIFHQKENIATSSSQTTSLCGIYYLNGNSVQIASRYLSTENVLHSRKTTTQNSRAQMTGLSHSRVFSANTTRNHLMCINTF